MYASQGLNLGLFAQIVFEPLLCPVSSALWDLHLQNTELCRELWILWPLCPLRMDKWPQSSKHSLKK